MGLIIKKHIGHEKSYLLYEVYSSKEQYLYDLLLCPLWSNEENLKEGRFTYFTYEPQELKVNITQKKNETIEEFNNRFNRIINWLGEHADTPWSLNIDAKNMKDISYIFSFENTTLAVTFHLVWI